MGPSGTGSVSFALVKLQHLVQSFESIGAGTEPTEDSVRKALRLVMQLGVTALPLCVRELGASDGRRARWAELLLAQLGARPDLHERVVTALREVVGRGQGVAGKRARSVLADLGEELAGLADAAEEGAGRAAPQGADQVGQGPGLAGEDGDADAEALRVALGGLRSQAEVALAADRMLAELDGEVMVALVDELAESDPERALWLADELLLRNDLSAHTRQALRRVRAPLGLAGYASRPGGRGGRSSKGEGRSDDQGDDPSEGQGKGKPDAKARTGSAIAAVLIGRHASGRTVVVASRPVTERPGERPQRVRVMAMLLAADGALSDGLYSDAFAARRLDRELLGPLRRRGYRMATATIPQALEILREAARSTMCLGRPLPRAFYLGRDLLGMYDEHVAGLRVTDDDGPLLERGLQLMFEGNPGRARPVLERYVRRVPDSGEGRAALARCLMTLGALEPARAQLVQAIALDPDNPLHHWNLSAIAHRQGRAGGCYLALLDYLDLVGEGAFDAGAGACDARLETAHAFVLEYERLAQIEYPEARPAAVARAEDLVHKARQRLVETRLDAAVALLEQAVAMVPGYHPAWLQLGIAFEQSACLEDAERCLRQALALRPGDPAAVRALAALERKRQSAARAAARAAKERPDDGRNDGRNETQLVF
jgi:Flp pilus assembly protein TadD